MPKIELSTEVRAPVDRVFDLSRSIELHCVSTGNTGEQAIAGVTSGLIGLGQEVTWRARHFGVVQTLTSRITACDRPRHFRDEMVRGAFKRIHHDHWFESGVGGGTLMRDVFEYEAPLGVLGWVAETLVLNRYLRTLLLERNAVIRQAAESEEWKRFLF